MSKPVDIRDFRANEAKIAVLESTKAALVKHHDHMVTHLAELQEHVATVEEQIRMVGPALEAVEAQLSMYRGSGEGVTDFSRQQIRSLQSEEAEAMERARAFAAQGRFQLSRYEDLRTGDGQPLPPQDERGKRIDILTQQYLNGMKQ